MAQADITVGVDISQLVKATNETKKFARESKAAFDVVNSRMKVFGETSNIAFNKYGQGALLAQKRSNNLGVATQQLGYQVSDFIVQIQSGTNGFVAFGQQASQLVGVLPLVATQLGITASAAIGLSAGLGIAIPLVTAIGAYFSRTGENAKEAKTEIESLTDSLDKFELAQSAFMAGMTVSQFTLTEQLKSLNEQIDEAGDKINALQDGKGGGTQLSNIYEAGGLQEKLLKNQEKITELEELRDRVLARIQVKADKQIASMKEANELSLIANRYGEDSEQYRKKVLQYESEKLISLAKENGYSNETILSLLEQLRIKNALAQAARVSEDISKKESEFEKRVAAALKAEYDATIAARQAIAAARVKAEEDAKAKAAAAAREAEAAARKAEREKELEQREKIRAAIQKQNEETQKLKNTADQLTAPFDNFFMALVDGTTSAKDAFRSMASDIIQQLYRILVVEQLVQSISGAIQGYMAGPVQGPNLPSADGGGYTGSGPRSGGLDGKGGFMAMLHPRETVIDHTKGQSAGGTVVNQVFNISANTSDDTKRLITQTIAQASPAIINQSVGAVMNQRRRGGAMKSAFG